ncbi:MAG TPA: glutathionylspermidine synthase family protein [Caulobacteraceae bacterium]|nr:glutathionylspermidine synthase family protein [Caulobacteraceae bacterium]
MRRVRIDARPDWREKVENLGLWWHTTEDGRTYWDESAYWAFDLEEVERIEAATAELYDMVLKAVGRVIDRGELPAFGYSGHSAALIERSWAQRDWEPTLYGRFDLAYDGRDLKLLELNGDTPTSLLEAAVAQWFWLQERFPGQDQFNSIHEKLIDALALFAQHGGKGAPLHMTSVSPHPEDEGTVGYIAACAVEAGLDAVWVPVEGIGWREGRQGGGFVDLDDRPITALFKLYPWEWLLDETFGERLAGEVLSGRLRLIEPAWKMVASNKRLLVTLKEMFPASDLLLDATVFRDEAQGWTGGYVKKPVHGREGANASIVEQGVEIASRGGAYDDDLSVFQQRASLAQADGNWAVIGSWIVNRQACGMGVRESEGPITDNTARFVPHLIE